MPRHRVAAPGPRHLKQKSIFLKLSATFTSIALSGILGLALLEPASGVAPCQVESNSVGSVTTLKIVDTAQCSWQVPADISTIEIAVVGGGGGGGGRQFVAGGGAGQVLYNPAFSVTPGNAFTVTIGNGGAGGAYISASNKYSQAQNGGDTSFENFTAVGGGSAAGENDPFAGSVADRTWPARSGGSGGGNVDSQTIAASIKNSYAGWQSFGNAGGAGGGTNYLSGSLGGSGGGGGAGSVGGSPILDTTAETYTAGKGGAGIQLIGNCLASGGAGTAMVGYAWGRTASIVSAESAGCVDLAGNQVAQTNNGARLNIAPQPNTGSGGSINSSGDRNGSSGASGVVLIRYSTPQQFAQAPTPSITGEVQVGRTVTVSADGWSDSPSFTYQWNLDGTPVSLETTTNYVIRANDLGKTLSVTVSASAPGIISSSRTSNGSVVAAYSNGNIISAPQPQAPAPQASTPVETPTPTPSPSSTSKPAPLPAVSSRPNPAPTQGTNQIEAPQASPSTPPLIVATTPSGSPTTQTTPETTDDSTAQPAAAMSTISEVLSAPVEALSNAVAEVFQNLQIGEAQANPALGATGDDNSPQVPFNPMGSEESVQAVTQTVVQGVVIVSGIAAAAAAAAGAAGAAAAGAAGIGVGAPTRTMSSGSSASSTNGSGSSSSNSEVQGFERLEVVHEEYSSQSGHWGDRLGIFKVGFITAIDVAARKFSERIAYFSPLLAKAGNDAAHLRAMFGSLALVLPVFAIYVASQALQISGGSVSTPPWVMLLTITFIGVFDVMAGLLGAIVFVAGTIIFAAAPLQIADYRLLGGVITVSIAPMIVAGAFRKIRKLPANNFGSWWERLTDLAIIPFMSGWTVSSMVSMLPSIAGVTLPVANHVNDFAIVVAAAALLRVLLEEFSARYFPARLNTVNPDDLPDPPMIQKAISLGIKYSIWVLISGALLGSSWQIWVGSALFLMPTVVSWFSNKLPNLPSLWRFWPTGLPGLVVNLALSGATTTVVAMLLGPTPDFAKWSFLLLGLPGLMFSLIGQLARHGETADEVKPIKRFGLLYRVGGVILLMVTLRMTGIL